jgi:DNA-directed RNA polymerase subunit H (RpoH/RPB5)
MEDIIQELAKIRGYEIRNERVFDEKEEVFFFYTPLFDQEFLNSMNVDARSFVFCDRIKKLRVPRESMKNIKVYVLKLFKIQMSASKFKPRHVKLAGEELRVMEKYRGKLPLLSANDAAAVVHDFKAGDIVKIYRLNGTIYFREVE